MDEDEEKQWKDDDDFFGRMEESQRKFYKEMRKERITDEKADDRFFLRSTYLAWVEQGASHVDAMKTAFTALKEIDDHMEQRG